MFQKLFFTVLALLMVSACGNTPAPASTPADTSSSESEPTPALLGETGPVTRAIEVQEPWVEVHTEPGTVRANPGRMPVVDENDYPVFLTLVNNGNTADALVEVSSSVTDTVVLLETEPPQNVRAVSQIEIPAFGQVVVDPGPGYHIILRDLDDELRVGDEVDLMLTFQQTGQITVSAPVTQPRIERGNIR